jgi:hypothetical protein
MRNIKSSMKSFKYLGRRELGEGLSFFIFYFVCFHSTA